VAKQRYIFSVYKLGIKQRWVQILYSTALLRERCLQYYLERRLGGPQWQPGHCEEGDNLSCQDSNLIPYPPTSLKPGARHNCSCRMWKVPPVVYNTQNYWASGLCSSPRILITRKHNVSETGPVSVLRWGEIQRLRLALSKGPNRVVVSLPSHEEGNRSSIRNTVFSSTQNSGRWTKSRNPVISTAAHVKGCLIN
jgi:hypothetical protein